MPGRLRAAVVRAAPSRGFLRNRKDSEASLFILIHEKTTSVFESFSFFPSAEFDRELAWGSSPWAGPGRNGGPSGG